MWCMAVIMNTDSSHQCKMLVSCYFESSMIQTFSVRSNVPGPRSQVLCPKYHIPRSRFQFPGPRSCDSELNNIYPCNGVWVTFIDQATNCSTSVFATWVVHTTIIVHEIIDYMNSMCECIWTWYVVYTQSSCLRQTSRSCWLQFETMLACPSSRSQVPGPGSQVPGPRSQVPGTRSQRQSKKWPL